MTGYGFEDENDHELPDLPKLPKKAGRVSNERLKSVVKAGEELGFVPRNPSVTNRSRKAVNKEPQGKILVTGPERVLSALRDLSISKDQPYWKVIEELISETS